MNKSLAQQLHELIEDSKINLNQQVAFELNALGDEISCLIEKNKLIECNKNTKDSQNDKV